MEILHAKNIVTRSTTIILSLMATPVLQAADDWPSYNRSLASDRYSPLAEINAGNVMKLRALCQYDTEQESNFQTGLIQVDGALYGTTDTDTFSIDAETCKENWRVREVYLGAISRGNRGVALIDGKVVRGTPDGRAVAYDAKNGQKLWSTALSDPKKGEAIKSAPIAYKGRVYIGNVGAEKQGGKGHVFALNAENGTVEWQFFMVPQQAQDNPIAPLGKSPSSPGGSWSIDEDVTISGGGTWTSFSLDEETGTLYVPGGNPAPVFSPGLFEKEYLMHSSLLALDAETGDYKAHYPFVLQDFHDWDVSSTAAIIRTREGKKAFALTPKNGYLYLFDMNASRLFAELPLTTMKNEKAPLSDEGIYVCPGMLGGSEWNGPSYSPNSNLLYSGQVDWCSIIEVEGPETWSALSSTTQGWTGSRGTVATMDDVSRARGWVVATDADSGQKAWSYQSEAPVVSGVTSTAANLVFAGDTAGNIFALNSQTGEKLWSKRVDGAIGGGVITYNAGHGQRLAIAAGMTSALWKTSTTSGKVIIYGL